MKNSLIICFCFFAVSGFSQQTNVENKITQLLNEAIAQNKCVGISAGFSTGETTQTAEAGLRDIEKNLPFSANTPSRTASITKPMTAIAIMQLVEQGKIDLDAPIQTYIADFPIKEEGEITVRHLLSHASGIGGYKSGKERNNKKDYATLTDATDLFKDRKLLANPGEAFNYTSYGYTVLGLVIEQVSGMSFEDYLRKNIWEKADMQNTQIEYNNQSYDEKSALYHRSKKGKIKKEKRTNLTDRIPGGGVISTVEDLLKFGDAVLNNSLISSETIAKMSIDTGLKKEGNPYGFGWYLYSETFGSLDSKYSNSFGHTGGQIGTSALLLLLPDQNTSIVVMSNTSGALQEAFNISAQIIGITAKSTNDD